MGTRFQVTRPEPAGDAPAEGEGEALELELIEVTEAPQTPMEGFRSQFAVLFNGPLERVMPQGTYRLEQEQSGSMELFLVPVGPDSRAEPGRAPAAMQYEAVFA